MDTKLDARPVETFLEWGATMAAPRIRERSWSNVAVCSFRRPAREMRKAGDRHRINLQLAPVPNATVQVESARPRWLTLSGLSFAPAGVSVRTVMGAGEGIGVLQATEIYDGIGCELAMPGSRLVYEPVWSIDDPSLETLVHLLLQEVDSPFVDHLVADALNRAIAIQLVRRIVGSTARLSSAGRLSRARLARVVDYIDAHVGGPLTLAEIAELVSLSPFHFSRCFKQTFGVSLPNFVARRRIERAKALLVDPRQPLAEIALVVGFGSQASFSTRFKREVGLSPGLFRKAH